MVIANASGGGTYDCPHCQVGIMKRQHKYKYEGVYDVYTCELCEGELIDWESINDREV